MKKALLLLLAALILLPEINKADEGMWIPLMLKDPRLFERMQQRGLQIPANQIYNEDTASIKDAVAWFNRGCSGQIISDRGLLLTNHHCGYSQIQSHSSVENNLLQNGFWAADLSEELHNPGVTVTFIISITNVTDSLLPLISPDMGSAQINEAIQPVMNRMQARATEGTHYEAFTRPFYEGNQYYMFVTETFRDIRLVGTPPSSIGKFGGDTDNWMWPRHTGDFALFRIYAAPDNTPADYSPDNVPFTPRYHLPISLENREEGDFTMVFGFPGRTNQYLPSFAVEQIRHISYPERIKIRTERLNVLAESMNQSEELNIQYSPKYASISNAWKKWQGEIRGLDRLNAVERKRQQEAAFNQWVQQDSTRIARYGTLISDYEAIYSLMDESTLIRDYINEAVFGIDIMELAWRFQLMLENQGHPRFEQERERIRNMVPGFYASTHLPTDQRMFAAMMRLYYENVPANIRPDVFRDLERRHRGDFQAWADRIYSRSMLTDRSAVENVLENPNRRNLRRIENDPLVQLSTDILNHYRSTQAPQISIFNESLSQMDRMFMAARMQMFPDSLFYPDANSTMRITFGQVSSYFPRDAVHYQPFTTLEGVNEKHNPAVAEFNTPERLLELYRNSDFGRYGVNGTMPVNFIASNHTTGGNSGSPVLNAQGHLIGTNFDRNWEGTMSDIMYNPHQVRNISVDIRYTLFIIDKFAGATHLINEMTIVE